MIVTFAVVARAHQSDLQVTPYNLWGIVWVITVHFYKASIIFCVPEGKLRNTDDEKKCDVIY